MNAGPVANMLAGRFDPLQFIKIVSKLGHTRALDLRYLAHSSDWVELALPANPRLVSDAETGAVASGAIVGLMDMAMSTAIWVARDRFVPQATLDLRLESLRPATVEVDVIGRGTCTGLHGDLAFASGIAHQGDPDDPVARLTATFMATAG